jgi:hypothetical protein
MIAIETPNDLRLFAEQFALREDWHEPEEQGVDAEVVGNHLDNAFGVGSERREPSEFVVVLKHEGEGVAKVNLATLLSWAAMVEGECPHEHWYDDEDYSGKGYRVCEDCGKSIALSEIVPAHRQEP